MPEPVKKSTLGQSQSKNDWLRNTGHNKVYTKIL